MFLNRRMDYDFPEEEEWKIEKKAFPFLNSARAGADYITFNYNMPLSRAAIKWEEIRPINLDAFDTSQSRISTTSLGSCLLRRNEENDDPTRRFERI